MLFIERQRGTVSNAVNL